jgi:gas vesicle protein
MSETAIRYWTVFSLGVIAGAVVALIYAPQSGEKTRKQLKRNLEDAGDYLKDTSDELGKHARRAIKKSKDVVDEVSSRLGSAAGSVSDKIGDLV